MYKLLPTARKRMETRTKEQKEDKMQRQEDLWVFKVSLVYRVNSETARAL